VNTFSPECIERRAGAIIADPLAFEAVAEAARPAGRERHASCYSPSRRRCANDRDSCRRSGRSVHGGYGMATKWDRDYHSPCGGMIEDSGPDTPRSSPGEGCPLGHSPCGIFEAIYPVSLSVHLSARPFRPDRCLSLRPFCGMTAEFTENLTLSRAHARGDSPWSLERLSLTSPWGPAICLLRMRLAAIRCGMHRMGYAIRGVFRCHCLIY
jgi:hypothetical protein